MTTTGNRAHGLDVARGVLLAAMVAVHIVSAHGPAAHVNALHGWVGVFLISSGFVGLSGYVIGLRSRELGLATVARGVDRGIQLLVVMFGYGVLFSLLRHVLAFAGAGGECAAEHGWQPPLRFDDLGILLPIAVVQMLGTLAGARARVVIVVLVALAATVMVLPPLTSNIEGNVVIDIFTRRSLTPFYTITTFIAIGLVGVALGRARPAWLTRACPRAVAATCVVTAIVLASPRVSGPFLDRLYLATGVYGGALLTLAFWSGILAVFIRGFSTVKAGGDLAAAMGRHSLLVFVLHDLLLVLDAAARDRLQIAKAGWFVLVLLVVNLAVLVLVARAADRSSRVRAVADAMLLGRSKPGSLVGGGAFSLLGGLVLAALLAVYTSAALARTSSVLVVDDFESARCPRWWTFGFLPFERKAMSGAHGRFALDARGPAPGSYAHGRGLFLDRELGNRTRLVMLVHGDGPGSGRIKIELCEDDNGNWEIEKQPPLYVPLYDDRFVHELSVDWRGWRTVEIPLSLFRDDNPGGNGIFDPQRDLTSGGLLELQLLFAPTGTFGDDVRISIDHIRFAP
jgi:fucose 4-O-acetylase-like acetyltransferase